MVRFEHRRYPALTLQDDSHPTDIGATAWARFIPERRRLGEHEYTVGILDTDDPDLIRRLRAAAGRDPDLIEGTAPASEADDAGELVDQVPAGAVADVLAWVGTDPDRAVAARTVERARDGRPRSTLVAALDELIGDQP